MFFTKVVGSLSLLAGLASAAPNPIARRQAAGAQNVVYWGQNGGGTSIDVLYYSTRCIELTCV